MRNSAEERASRAKVFVLAQRGEGERRKRSCAQAVRRDLLRELALVTDANASAEDS